MNFNEVKNEIESIDCACSWTCNGRTYGIPLMNGDIESQKGFLEYADIFEFGKDDKPSRLAEFLGNFMYELLKMKNDVTKEECSKISTVPNCTKVFNIWLGNEQ